KRLQIPINVEAYIQSIVLKKTVETISFDRRRVLESEPNAEESWESASLSVILGAEMHKQPILPLKQVDNEEDDVKTENTKNILPHIFDGITTAKEPSTNTNEELENGFMGESIGSGIRNGYMGEYIGRSIRNGYRGESIGSSINKVCKNGIKNVLRNYIRTNIKSIFMSVLCIPCEAVVTQALRTPVAINSTDSQVYEPDPLSEPSKEKRKGMFGRTVRTVRD
ncbi:hypothetical protein CWI37_2676p0010, partial [Hamiltosporidium tvaerminnensis]